MTKYASDHAGALLDVTEAGSAVTFTRTNPGTYDATTDTYSSPSTSTVTGDAIQVAGNPEQYKALELIESEAPTLFFTPDTYGQLPELGDTVVWNSVTYTVRAKQPIAPDGTAIAARLVVAR
jgi:hypothetical protein